MTKPIRIFHWLCILILPALALTATAETNQRMIVLTDIEADPDDTQTLVRLMLYANQIDIKGLVATRGPAGKSVEFSHFADNLLIYFII